MSGKSEREFDDILPEEPCLICNAEARAALSDGARQITEELIAERPHDIVPELGCWNCLGRGVVHGKNPPTFKDYVDRMKESH